MGWDMERQEERRGKQCIYTPVRTSDILTSPRGVEPNVRHWKYPITWFDTWIAVTLCFLFTPTPFISHSHVQSVKDGLDLSLKLHHFIYSFHFVRLFITFLTLFCTSIYNHMFFTFSPASQCLKNLWQATPKIGGGGGGGGGGDQVSRVSFY